MFITFEGPEGSGKTTLMRSLGERLREESHNVVLTREPGEGPVGADIRRLLLEGGDLEHLTEVFLFLADRAQHVADFIKPALAAGRVVLCDRFADSTVVYQGHARGLNIERLRDWNSAACAGTYPTVTFLLDLDPKEGLARIQDKDRLDREPIEFHEKVRSGFLAEAAQDPNRWHVLDAARPPEEVAQEAYGVLKSRWHKTRYGELNTISPRLIE